MHDKRVSEKIEELSQDGVKKLDDKKRYLKYYVKKGLFDVNELPYMFSRDFFDWTSCISSPVADKKTPGRSKDFLISLDSLIPFKITPDRSKIVQNVTGQVNFFSKFHRARSNFENYYRAGPPGKFHLCADTGSHWIDIRNKMYSSSVALKFSIIDQENVEFQVEDLRKSLPNNKFF